MDEEYSAGDWIFPEIVCDNLKNRGLKIKANVSLGNTWTYWMLGHCVTRGSEGDICIVKNNKIYDIRVETSNLFKIVQNLKIDENGFLPGTYKLLELKDNIYKIIPEGTPEEILKTRYSKIYNSKSIPFTKKMIPGHIYVSKNKKLYICLGSNFDYYSKLSYRPYGFGFYHNLINYSDIPRKVKILFSIDYERDSKIKTIQELAYSDINSGSIFCDSFSGKDLGQYLLDDGRPWEDYMLDHPKKDDIFGCWFFINELYRKESDFNKILRKHNPENEGIIRYNPKAQIIYDI